MTVLTAIASISGSFVLALLLTPLVRRLAIRLGIVDRPELAPDRKEPGRRVPLLGGWAVFLAFSLVVGGLAIFGFLNDGSIAPKAVFGLVLGGGLLMIGGSLDDRFNLKPGQQLLWSLLAICVVIVSGIGISFMTNPFGGVIDFDRWAVTAFSMNGIDYRIVLVADLVTFVWLLGMMYTTKLLDGLDGLVSGVVAIGSLIIFGVSQLADVQQVGTGLVALALAGSCLGFLVFNFAPAKIFLGEGGSLFLGFLLGSLAIVSGGKIATALLIMGVPILDVAWVVVRRWFLERRSPFRSADRKHLHFRLLDVGLSTRQAVLILYAFTAAFGGASLFARGTAKLIVLGVLVLVMAGLGAWLVARVKQRTRGMP